MMDRPGMDENLLVEDLKNLRTFNRLFGGLRAVRKHLPELFRRIPPAETVQVLDLATGSGDHAVSAVHFARSAHRNVRVIGVDKNPTMIGIARRLTAGFPEI